jgi:hypothetical protein
MACLFLYKAAPDCIKRVSKCLSIVLYPVLAAPLQMSIHRELQAPKLFLLENKDSQTAVKPAFFKRINIERSVDFFPVFSNLHFYCNLYFIPASLQLILSSTRQDIKMCHAETLLTT